MRVGIIGAGKVGCSLALGLSEKGFDISGVYSRNPESAKFLCEKLNLPFDNNLVSTVRNSELIFITVTDTQIETVSSEIEKKCDNLDICCKAFIHCSGAITSESLKFIKEKGGHTASLHPIQTFADKSEGFKGLEGIYFGFEGDLESRKLADIIVKAFNGSMLTIEKDNKPIYHAATCILSNYVVALAYLTGNLFEKIGIDSTIGIKAFTPLIERTVKNIGSLGSENSLTGPISRGDYNVLMAHIKSLKDKSPETVEVYAILGKIALELALKKGSINNEIADKIYKILN